MSKELQSVLDTVAQGAQLLGGYLPGPGGIVAKVIGIAVSSAAAFAKAGKDPVIEIERIHSADPLVTSVHGDWQRSIDERFGPRPDAVPPPPDTQRAADSSDDPYDDEEEG